MKNLPDEKIDHKVNKLAIKIANLSFMKNTPVKIKQKMSPNFDKNNPTKQGDGLKPNSNDKNYNFSKIIKINDSRNGFKTNIDLPTTSIAHENVKINPISKAYQNYNLIQMSQAIDGEVNANSKPNKYSYKKAVEENQLDDNYKIANPYWGDQKSSINNITNLKEERPNEAIKKSNISYRFKAALTNNYSSLSKLHKRTQINTKPMKITLPKIEDKEMEITESCDISVFFENDNYIFNFFSQIHSKNSIYDQFRDYFAFIQDTSFDIILSLFSSHRLSEQFKKALILERISIFICFYYDLNKSYNREIEFLKKFISVVYANSYILIKIFVTNCETDVFEKQIERIRNRKLVLNEENVEKNNSKLHNMLETLIKDLDPIVGTCFTKIGRFQHEFSLDEAFKYLIDVFSELVK